MSAERIAQIRARLRAGIGAPLSLVEEESLHDDLAFLLAEVERLRADAARLEWWTENGHEIYFIRQDGKLMWVAVWMADDSGDNYRRCSAPTYREAIDAAMQSMQDGVA